MSKILLVDDNTLVLTAATRLLRHAGHDVTYVMNAQDALWALEHSYDLVITDWEMPDMLGDSLCRTIKAKHPKLPVILVSGNGAVHKLDCGADAVFTKPYKSSDMRAAIDRLTRKEVVDGLP